MLVFFGGWKYAWMNASWPQQHDEPYGLYVARVRFYGEGSP